MSELKPCPLCGSEVGWASGSIRCSRCGLSYGAPVSKEKVERRWNTRAERTCEDVSENPLRFECSACGGVSLDIVPNYCPCCGAKVVSE